MSPKWIGGCLNILTLFAPEMANKFAFQLFCMPRRGRLKPKDATFLQTASESKKILTEVGQVQLYKWSGSTNQFILLLHGWESNAGRWHQFVPQLIDNGYSVMAIDAPAHGQSDGRLFTAVKYAQAIKAVHDHYSIGGAIGHSLGGYAYMYYRSHLGMEQHSRVVLMGVPSNFTDIFDRYTQTLGLSNKVRLRLGDYFQIHFKKPLSYFSVADFCLSISSPTLIVHDRQDNIAPFKDSDAYLANLKNAKRMITDGLGHRLRSPIVYDRITAFLKEQ